MGQLTTLDSVDVWMTSDHYCQSFYGNCEKERGEGASLPCSFCNREEVRVVSMKSDLCLGVRVEGLQGFDEVRAEAPSLQWSKQVWPGGSVKCLLKVYGKKIALLRGSSIPS